MNSREERKLFSVQDSIRATEEFHTRRTRKMNRGGGVLSWVLAIAIALPVSAFGIALIAAPVSATDSRPALVASASSAFSNAIETLHTVWGRLFASEEVPSPSLAANGSTVAIVPSQAPTPVRPSTAVQPVASSTVIYQTIQQPVIERIVETQRVVTQGGITETTLGDRLNQLENKLRSLITSQGSQQSAQTSAVYNAVALSQRIDNLANVTITNPTITGGSITAASIVGSISNAISSAVATIADLTSTTITATNVTFTNSTTTNATTTNFAVVGTATSTFGGGISVTALNLTGTATSTAANGFNLTSGCFALNGVCISGGGGSGVSLSAANTWTALQLFSAGASTTNFSNFGTAYFGGTATSSFSNAGVLTLATPLAASSGGTGTSTAPTYGKVLVGNALGGYDLTATSSLGITGSGGGTWGSIIGTLSSQSDLQAALDAKLSLTNWYATTTDALAQGSTNKYWSNTLFDNRLSATTTLSNITTLANLATVGTITSGTWNGTAVGDTYISSAATWNAKEPAISAGTINDYWRGDKTFQATSTLRLAKSQITDFGTYEAPLTFNYPLTRSVNAISTVATSSLGLTVSSFASPNISQWTNNSGYLTSLAGAASSTLLADTNTFSGTNTFSSTVTGSVSGNAGTVTNGVYTTTFNGLFDNRLSATTTLPNLTTLANLATVGTVTSGTWSGSFGAISGANLTNLAAANIAGGTAGINISGNAGTVTNGVYTTTFNGLFDNRLSASSSISGITTLPNLSLPSGQVSGLGSLATLSSINNGNWSGTALSVANGGTGQSAFGQGWLSSNGTTLSASTSPTVNYITATSTTATSTFAAGIQSTYLNLTGASATSTAANGFNLSAGCFSILGTCVGGASSQWTTSGSNIYFNTGSVSIGTTTPGRTFTVFNTAANAQQRISYDATRFGEFYVDASGDLQLSATGKNLRALDANLYLCDGGACPTTPVQGYPTFTSQGNLVAGGTIYAGAFGPVSCPSGMIPVPASPADGQQGFCVDKYEAQSSAGNEVSVSGGSPWVSITQTSARAECIRAGKHLITEREWMTIAHNAENVGWNWNGGVAGTNQMSDGHSDNAPASALATAADTSPCSGTGQTCDTSTWDAQRRTYKLSNGEYIWDLGGNVWEWVDQTVTNDYPIVNSAAAGWQACSTSGDGICGNTRTTNDQWYRGGFATIAGFIRGGGWSNGAVGGAFALYLSLAPSAANTTLGFRCSR